MRPIRAPRHGTGAAAGPVFLAVAFRAAAFLGPGFPGAAFLGSAFPEPDVAGLAGSAESADFVGFTVFAGFVVLVVLAFGGCGRSARSPGSGGGVVLGVGDGDGWWCMAGMTAPVRVNVGGRMGVWGS